MRVSAYADGKIGGLTLVSIFVIFLMAQPSPDLLCLAANTQP